jgi:SAM-dependent methyltransferase
MVVSPPNLDADWEFRYAPYDALTYETALQYLEQTDIVLDIGAGDLRFARQAAARVRCVIAIEQNAGLLQRALAQAPLPENVHVICADARSYDFPPGITAGVLLMRHCTHFRLYLEKLRQSGARRSSPMPAGA